jgi:hypothetical protein
VNERKEEQVTVACEEQGSKTKVSIVVIIVWQSAGKSALERTTTGIDLRDTRGYLEHRICKRPSPETFSIIQEERSPSQFRRVAKWVAVPLRVGE